MKRLQQSRHALGSAAVLTIVIDKQIDATATFTELWQQVTTFEQRFSRFLATSELSKINHSAGKPTDISYEMHRLLTTAKEMTQKTDGLYNPFILPALQQAGYKGSWPAPETVQKQVNYEDRSGADAQDLQLGRGSVTIPKNTALDFGGIGKGYLLDQLSDWLISQGITNYWLSLGGDIICNGTNEADEPWNINIQHALQEDKIAASVNNHGKLLAVATSGITKRRGITSTGQWHHIIDPRTKKPAATDVLTATVCVRSATAADVFAKCLVIDTLASKFAKDILLQRATPNGVTIEKNGAIWS